MMEKVSIAKSRETNSTTICVTRYGNVMASRGSVIPLFISQILAGREVTVTDLEMTRFMMTLDDAVNLVLFAFEHGEPGDIYVQKSPAATLSVLVEALFNLFGIANPKLKVIGTRHGEKLFESLLTREEMVAAHDLGRYNSHNATRLDVKDVVELLASLPLIQAIKRGEDLSLEKFHG
jgi:UDP-glucose 4-epimerase